MSTDDHMETITDPAVIRATDEPDPFRRNPVAQTGPDDPWRFTRFVADDHECVIVRDEYDEPAPFGSCATHRRALSSPVALGCATPAPVGAAVALDLDASHVRTDPACTFHDGTTPPASRGKRCPACMRLDLDAIERRANGATPGWWQEVDDLDGGWQVLSGKGEEITGSGLPIADAEFIATLDPPTVLALVAEVRRLTESRSTVAANLAASLLRAEAEVRTLRAKVAAVEDLHWKVGGACSHCSQRSDYAVAWPCETAVALAGTTGEGE